jgi:hypothetical protein
MTQELRDKWTATARRILVGRKIIEAKYDRTNLLFLVLDDGTQIVPMSDDEGNDPGALHIVDKNNNFEILPTL